MIAIARERVSPVATTRSAPSQAEMSASSISVRDVASHWAAAFAAEVDRPLARNSFALRDWKNAARSTGYECDSNPSRCTRSVWSQFAETDSSWPRERSSSATARCGWTSPRVPWQSSAIFTVFPFEWSDAETVRVPWSGGL